MGDSPQGSPAWSLDPASYLEARVPTHAVPPPRSLYLEMADGVRLAADIYIPEGDRPDGGFPAILHLTPYYRRFALNDKLSEPLCYKSVCACRQVGSVLFHGAHGQQSHFC